MWCVGCSQSRRSNLSRLRLDVERWMLNVGCIGCRQCRTERFSLPDKVAVELDAEKW
jgi:hypothetical protein